MKGYTVKLLDDVVELSHEFGTPTYVKGGGGNTSVKDSDTLWIKPSGTTLAGLTADGFVALDRAKIDELYSIDPPATADERETLVKDLMAAAVKDDTGRPSVEAPLHNSFDARFVVHTHPALGNGLTCARDGEEACRRLFPDALWVEYVDPGYTLCMRVRDDIATYKDEHGCQPSIVVLKNHGIFIAADTPDGIRALYARVMDALRAAYAAAGISETLSVNNSAPEAPGVESAIQTLLGDDAGHVVSSGTFAYSVGPLSPDHVLYAKPFPYVGELTVGMRPTSS